MFASPWADAPCRPQDVGMLTNNKLLNQGSTQDNLSDG